MKARLVTLLRCPACRGSLALGDAVTDDALPGEIAAGTLSCGACHAAYAISEGVPRLHAVRSGDDTRPRTAASFGYLWAQSVPGAEPYDPQAYHFAKMAARLPLGAVQGLVLDAGCGDGIDLANNAQRKNTEAIGVELSDGGCATAYARTRHLPHAHVVQADLSRLPFGDATFDFAYSYGVLHHMGVPENGLREIVRVAKSGATVAAYLYENFGERSLFMRAALATANTLRGVTVRLPHRVLYNLCRLASPFVYATFTLPARLGAHIRALAPAAGALPFRHGTSPFSLVGDLYDRLSAPVEFRYSRRGSEQFFAAAGLGDITVAAERGWMVCGTKPHG